MLRGLLPHPQLHVGHTQRHLQLLVLCGQFPLPGTTSGGVAALGETAAPALQALALPAADRLLTDLTTPRASAIDISPDRTLSTILNLSSTGIDGGRPIALDTRNHSRRLSRRPQTAV